MKNSNLPNFKYIFNNKSKTLDVLLHGAGQGMNSQFMLKLLDASGKSGKSVLSISFPFFDRGDEHSSGPELLEEIDSLQQVFEFCRLEKYTKIRLIGKSLGGIIASYYLKGLKPSELTKYEVVIFGYVTGSVKLQNFPGKVTIIQGEKDKFGDIKTVKKDLKDSRSKEINFFQVKNADHSYRNPETKEPIYEDIAIDYFFDK